jgi:hypothetical protein
MRCPSCHGENGYNDDSLCNSCWGDIEQQHEEYRQYLANLSPLQKAVRKVKGTINRTKNAVYRCTSFPSMRRIVILMRFADNLMDHACLVALLGVFALNQQWDTVHAMIFILSVYITGIVGTFSAACILKFRAMRRMYAAQIAPSKKEAAR